MYVITVWTDGVHNTVQRVGLLVHVKYHYRTSHVPSCIVILMWIPTYVLLLQ